MSPDKILVIIGGIFTIGFIWWFFFGKKEEPSFAKATDGQGSIDVIVDGGYKPSTIKVKKGKKTVISLLRKDASTCLEEFILPDFKIKKYLPVGEMVDVEITPEKTGTFGFHGGMNMYHGKIVVS